MLYSIFYTAWLGGWEICVDALALASCLFFSESRYPGAEAMHSLEARGHTFAPRSRISWLDHTLCDELRWCITRFVTYIHRGRVMICNILAVPSQR